MSLKNIGIYSATAIAVVAMGTPALVLADSKRGQDVKSRQAERQAGDDYKAVGMRAGSFKLLPSLDVEVEHNDNVFATETGEESDLISRVRPEIALKSDWNNHALNLNAKGEIVRYNDNDDDDVENYGYSVDGRIDAARTTKIKYGIGYAVDHADRGDPDQTSTANAPTEDNTTDANLGIEFKPGKLSISLDGSYKEQDYFDDTNIDGSTTNNDDRDRETRSIEGRVGYEFTPGREAFIRTKLIEVEYDSATDDAGSNRNSDGYNLVVGTTLDLTGVVTGEVYAGYKSRSYDDAGFSDIDGPTAGAKLNWDISKLTSLKLDISQNIQETTTAGSPGFVTTSGAVTAQHELSRQLTLTGTIKLAEDDYEDISRTDDTITAEIGGKYLISRVLSVAANYSYKDKDSSQSGSSYTQNKAMFTIGGQF